MPDPSGAVCCRITIYLEHHPAASSNQRLLFIFSNATQFVYFGSNLASDTPPGCSGHSPDATLNPYWNVPSDRIDWVAVAVGQEEAHVPQLPGAGNAMGRVKFMLPDDQGSYLHDARANRS